MGEDYWEHLEGRKALDDDAADAAVGRQQPENAAWIGLMFLHALEELQVNFLKALVTPESLPDWGDFVAAREMLRDVPDRGVGSIANRALGARDVAYVKVLPHVAEGFVVAKQQPIIVSLIVTLVWRPELGSWRVHSLGDLLKPEALPRTSANVAPRDHINQ